MLDANSNLSDDKAFQEFVSEAQLFDLHSSTPAPSTYIGAPNRRIDYIFGCHRVLGALQRSGSLSYHDGPHSDHRGLFIDVDFKILLGCRPSPHPISASAARLLKAGNPELVHKYNESMRDYYAKHNMAARIDRLYETYWSMPREAVRKELEAWDNDQGRAMQTSEKTLGKPPCKYSWSPVLQNAGLIREYWKLRLRDIIASTNHTSKIKRLEEKIRHHD